MVITITVFIVIYFTLSIPAVLFLARRTVQTEYHEFLCCETETDQQKMAFYLPVTPEGQQKWILLFSVSKDSQMEFNAYAIREDILKTFHSLK